MTIYAIVNNLIYPGSSGLKEEPIWTIVSGNSILQGGNPYFVPDFAERFEIRPALALKIGKLGKGIPERFAYRYLSGAAPCLLMAAADLLDNLKASGLPWTKAVSYDRSTVLGKFSEIAPDAIVRSRISVTLESGNDTIRMEWTPESMRQTAEETIAALSCDNTLKTGDIILAGISAEGPAIFPGMRATVTLNGEEPLKFNIR